LSAQGQNQLLAAEEVLSGASQETEQKAIEMGAVRTLSKPVQGIELVDIINELVA
jgi:CheY-like chemotaxis protein